MYRRRRVGNGDGHTDRNEDGHTDRNGDGHTDRDHHGAIGVGTNSMDVITLGEHVSIGTNSWITEDIPDNTTVSISDLKRKPND